ncbi:hypothetical protein Tco_0858916 [Tanacetum coccineum]|uniref:Uncharacterized protein n=1 Tax=Tanacetum coccineum TaxID=301880 RepID=A0ABQ5BG68_9ASTR
MKGRPRVFLGYPPGTKEEEEIFYLHASGSMKLSKKRKDLNDESNATKIGHGEPIEEFKDDFKHHTQTEAPSDVHTKKEAPSEDHTEDDVGPKGSQYEDNQFGQTEEPTFSFDTIINLW